MKPSTFRLRNYFVDEAGDPTLFSKRDGRVIVGTIGCSRYFILGLVDIPNLTPLITDLNSLRNRLLADPYFKDVPSMQPEAHKTVEVFHAKDDLPEVRREVLTLLRHYQCHFSAIVRDKLRVIQYVRSRNHYDPTYHYHPNELYDHLVRLLFKTHLHKDDEYHIYFAKRGKGDRTAALSTALKITQQRFLKQHKLANHTVVEVIPAKPVDCPGLQVTDYFLWALQRFYERKEVRYIEMLWDSVSVIHDMDDTRQTPYGVYYTRKKPLSLAALQDRPEI
ncbi:MAG: DUF3800 domain-containing protein [Anaerolineae bacterium]|nr:DUF3800 domain-containing protein [Anaerolineae bacterium]